MGNQENGSGSFSHEIFEGVFLDGSSPLSIIEFNEVARQYDLGDICQVPMVESGGAVNHNFLLTTKKGKFMVRVKDKILDGARLKRKNLEYATLDYLRHSGFEFEVPNYLFSNSGTRFIEMGGRTYDVYPRLSGSTQEGKSVRNNPEVVRAVAIYHKVMLDFPDETRPAEHEAVFDLNGRLLGKLNSIKAKVANSDTEADRVVEANLGLLFDAYHALAKGYTQSAPRLVIHDDLHGGNLLFDGSRVRGIIDFENVRWGPIERDLRKLVSGKPEDISWLANEYRKHNEISDREVENILPERIHGYLRSINWVYDGRVKGGNRKALDLEGNFRKLRKTLDYWSGQG